jgi:hypothetical protein
MDGLKVERKIFADAVLAKVEMDRKLPMIKAWEESEKSRAENKYIYLYMALSNICC